MQLVRFKEQARVCSPWHDSPGIGLLDVPAVSAGLFGARQPQRQRCRPQRRAHQTRLCQATAAEDPASSTGPWGSR